MPSSRPNKWRARSANTSSLDNHHQPNPRPTTRLNTNKFHPTQATSFPPKPRHSRQATSFPRTREPRIHKAHRFSAQTTSFPPNHVIPAKLRHSRGRGNPESTNHVIPTPNHVIPAKPRHSRQATSFPRTREPRIHKARRFSAQTTSSPRKPRHSRQATSFPRTREPRIHKARRFSAQATSFPPSYVIPAKPRHSRGRGNPESIKHAVSPPKPRHSRQATSFPRTREPRIHKARRFCAKPRHSHSKPRHPAPSYVIPADAGIQNP